jgi:hypothetical protein
MRSILVAAFVLALGPGCSPRVAEDGSILCGASDNTCPPLLTCWSDRRCRRGLEPRDAGASTDVGPVDAPPLPNRGNGCSTSMMCTSGDTCEAGACLTACTATMPPMMGACRNPGEVCIPVPMHIEGVGGVCATSCVGGTPCPANFRCESMAMNRCLPMAW